MTESNKVLAWEELSELEQLRCIYSDCYKDAMGFRPRFPIQSKTEDELRKEIDEFSRMIDEQETLRIEEEKLAINNFEYRIDSLMQFGAKNRAMAIRWLTESISDADYEQDKDYVCYRFGLPFGYLNKEA